MAYLKAARLLLEEKYCAQNLLAPNHLRAPCNVYVLRCTNGYLVRYDASSTEKYTLVCGRLELELEQAAPLISENVVHFPVAPQSYAPKPGGPEISVSTTDSQTGVTTIVAKTRVMIYATAKLPADFIVPTPPSRPPCLISLQNAFEFRMEGFLEPKDVPQRASKPATEKFIARAPYKLPVGWQAIEVYPFLDEKYWKDENAPMWAELDVLACIARRNLEISALTAIDSRGPARRKYAALLSEFGSSSQWPRRAGTSILEVTPRDPLTSPRRSMVQACIRLRTGQESVRLRFPRTVQ